MDALSLVCYDPIAQQRITLDTIMGGSITTENPTNPLVTLTEAVSVTTSNALNEFIQSEKYTFPSLATKEEELYPHITNEDEYNLFATPAKTKIKMFIDLNSILTSAIFENGSYRTTIPKYSYVTVDGVNLVISNDINITINKIDGKYISFVNHTITDASTEYRNIGVLYSTITTLEDNTQWLTFDVPVTQMTMTVTEATITLGLDMSIDIPITDQYYHSIIEYKDALTGKYIEIDKMYVESMFDTVTAKAYVKITDTNVFIKVPRLHIDNIIKSNTMRFTVFTTKGKIQTLLNKYTVNDFKLTLWDNRDTIYKASAFNLNYMVSSEYMLDGGVDKRNVRDMRKKFIYRTTGLIDNPITEYQLTESARLDGFYLDKITDTLFERVYVASKDIDSTLNENVPTNVYNVNAKISYSADMQNTIIINNDIIIVKPDTVFKNNNGKLTPLSKTEYNYINNLNAIDMSKYLNENKLLYNPFLYIIDSDANIQNSRIYSINKPKMDMLSIIDKNTYLKENVNITGYNIIKENDYYYLFFRLSGNDAYNLIKDRVKLQLSVEGKYGTVYFNSFVDVTLSDFYVGKDKDVIHIVKIDTDNFTINKEDNIVLANTGSTSTISLFSHSNIVIYYDGTDLTSTGGTQLNTTSYLKANEIKNKVDVIGLTRETIDIRFADKLNYLWNRVDNSYTDRKYKTYAYDIPKIYNSDVYDGAIPFTLSDTTGNRICDTLTLNIIHKKGEIVLDSNGNTVYEHRKGDVVYVDGQPVVDTIAGEVKFVDMLMFEYSYKASRQKIYVEHLKYVETLLLDWILIKMESMNNNLLDNTILKFKPRRSVELVTLVNGKKYNPVITPKVTLYYRKDTETFNIDRNDIYNKIKFVLNKYFGRPYISIMDMQNEIISVLDDSLLTVDISNYLDGEPKIIRLEKFSNRFELKKYVTSELKVKNNFILDIQYL